MYDRRKGRRRQALVSLCCLLAIGYFAYHATSGRRGYEARSRLIQRAGVLESEIARLEAARAALAQLSPAPADAAQDPHLAALLERLDARSVSRIERLSLSASVVGQAIEIVAVVRRRP